MLKAGGNVVLTVFGGQPPVMLTVEPSDHNEGMADLPLVFRDCRDYRLSAVQ